MTRQQVIPKDVAAVHPTTDSELHLKESEPELMSMVDDVVGALKQDMIPTALQEKLFDALNPAIKRQLVAKHSGLDANILGTFKDQLTLVDAIMRRTFNPDGTLRPTADSDLSMAPKDILNLSFKLSQMMVKDLPKVYSMDRIQRQEQALSEVIQEHMNREQQELFIDALDRRLDKL